MLFDEMEKTILKLNSIKRFHRINGEKFVWIYDSHSHKIYRMDSNLIEKGIINEDWNTFINSSLDDNLEFLLFCKSIQNSSQDYVEPILPSQRCTVMINTSNRCNLNCSYCYRNKKEPGVNSLETIKRTLEYAIKSYKPAATEYIVSYSMTSESSMDLPLLKQIADEYINFENYQFIYSDIKDGCFKDFYIRLKNDLQTFDSIDFPNENKTDVIKYLNSLLNVRNLFDILNLSESMFNEYDRNEVKKRHVLAKWRMYRLNRWCLELLYDKYLNKRKVPFVSFWFMTNGTCASQDFIDFVKSCDINPLWISFDGPKEVHNSNRKYNKGNGSYDDILSNIKIFQSNNIKLKASAVITADFPKPLEIINHILKIGFDEISLTPVRPGFECSFNNSNIKDLLIGYDEIFNTLESASLKNDFKLFHLLKEDMCLAPLFSLLRKIKLTKRCAFDDQIVVDSKGNIYPCLYFTGHKDFCYGKITEGIDSTKINHKLDINNRGSCNECWARYLCSGTCFYGSFVNTGNHLTPDPIECKIKKHLAERCLNLIVFLFEHNISINKIN